MCVCVCVRARACVHVRRVTSRASSPTLPISHPGFPSRLYLLHGFGAHPPSSHWPRRSILTRQELPESQRTPAPSWRLLAWPSRAVATRSVSLCVCSCRDSCQRGWRLLYIVAAYHSCSEVLQPHLVRFLQDVSRTPGLPFQGEGPVFMGIGWEASRGQKRRGLGPSHAHVY